MCCTTEIRIDLIEPLPNKLDYALSLFWIDVQSCDPRHWLDRSSSICEYTLVELGNLSLTRSDLLNISCYESIIFA